MHKHASANRFYRLVWSHVHACWVAVAEGARGQGKRGSTRRAARRLGMLLALGTAGGAALAGPPAVNALPSGAQLVAGQASIATSGNQMTVTQGSNQAILNWQRFDIGANAGVRFDQPSSAAVALNRVIGGDPSQIYGKLSSNGSVFLINPQGVLFGAGAQVDVGALGASSLNLSDSAFLSGRYDFAGSSGAGAVRNDGSIRVAAGGYVALIGPSVVNHGGISAPRGGVALAAGEQVSVDLRGDGLIGVRTTRGALKALAENSGAISADAGRVVLSAAAADALTRSTVNNTGIVQARGLAGDGGSIRLVGDGDVHAGALDVSSRAGAGGAIAVGGQFVALDGALNADGARGGSIDARAGGNLSVSAAASAAGASGAGGGIAYAAGKALVENSSAASRADGATDGGSITLGAGTGLASSALHSARGAAGAGGRIDASGKDVSLFSAVLDASGQTRGGLVRVGGAFQGGTPAAGAPDLARFVTRWGGAAAIANAGTTFINDSSAIDVSARGAAGQGGTAVVWSQDITTMLGALKATGAAAGGAVEISSKNDLRSIGLDKVTVGAGGQLLLDPKNLIIRADAGQWTYQAILGAGRSGGGNVNVGGLDSGDAYGAGVALSASGTQLAVGAPYDAGQDNATGAAGAVRLYTFTNDSFGGAMLRGTLGAGYTGNGNTNVSLPANALFGASVALSGDGRTLAVGAPGQQGGAGQVYEYRYSGANFSGATTTATVANPRGAFADAFGTAVALNSDGSKLAVGALYDGTAGTNAGAAHLYANGDLAAVTRTATVNGSGGDALFGTALAYNGAGDRLAVGAIGESNGRGAVYLYDTSAAPALLRKLSAGANGGSNTNVALLDGEYFGSALAFNAAGTRLAVGAPSSPASGGATLGPGAVRVYDFADTGYATPVLSATLGRGYGGAPNVDVPLNDYDSFGYAVALNGAGDRMVVGAPYSDGAQAGTAGSGSVHAFVLAPAPVDSQSYANPSGGTSTVSSVALAAQLASGVSLTLQASNDLTLDSGSAINAGAGAGSLTLQAGRSVVLNSTITLGGGSLTVVANDGKPTPSTGPVDADRDAGAATLTVNGALTGGGDVSLAIADGSGKTNRDNGALQVNAAVTARGISLKNQGPSVGTVALGAGGVLSASGSGTAIEVVAGPAGGGLFTNNSAQATPLGAGLNLTGAGRFLVYAANPATSVEGVSAAAYNKHYAQSYGGGTPAYAAAGNWFLYSIAPTLTITASNASKVYDGQGAGALAYSVGGYIDGDVSAALSGALGVAGGGRNAGSYAIGQGTLASAMGYTINLAGNGATLTVTPRALTVAAAGIDKVYDGTRNASVNYSSDAIGGDALSISGNASFADKNAQAGKSVAVSGITLGGADAGNYMLSSSTAATTASITPRTLNASATSAGKVYDGNTIASVTLGDDRVAGDQLVLAPGGASYADKQAGAAKTITVGGITLSGADAANYTLGAASVTTQAAITARTLNVSATGASKVYDGNRDAAVTLGDDRVNGDALTVSAAAAAYADKNVGNAKTVTASGLALGGADAGNYVLASSSANGTGTITARTLNAVATGATKVYDGTTAATVTYSDDRVAGDAITYGGSASYADKNAGAGKAVAIGSVTIGGADAGNYVLAAGGNPTTTGVITQRALTVSVGAAGKVYDGTTAASVTLGDDRVAGDQLALAGSANYDSKNAGNRSVIVSGITLGGADAGNYQVASGSATGAGVITPKALAFSVSGADKVYDGTTAAHVDFHDDRLAGDQLGFGANASYADKNVGAGKAVTVTGIALNGADAGNYTLASTSAATTAGITARTLTATASGVTRVYDGTTAAVATLGDNRVQGDQLTLTASGAAAYADKNAGSGKALSVTGVALSGADAGNYVLASNTANGTGTVTQKALTVAATGSDKVYDGTAAARVDYTDSGRIVGDQFIIGGTASYADKNVGTGKHITITGIALSGTDAGNYAVASATLDASGGITARALNVGIASAGKVYDGTTSAIVGMTDDRVGGDVLSFASNAASYADKNVGSGKTVSVSGIALSGADAGNYTLSNTGATTRADITPRTLTVTGSGVSKVYDGTAAASVTFADTRVGGDQLNVTVGSASYVDKNVDAHKALTFSGVALSGVDSGNYVLDVAGSGGTGAITPRTLNAGAAGVDKVYDGTTAATLAWNDDRVRGDVLAYNASASFADKNAGGAKTVNVAGVTLGGADSGNYVLALGNAPVRAAITPRVLAVTANAAGKVYDGTTAASATLSDDRIGGDVLTVTGGTAAFADKNAGAAKALSVSGVTLSGADAGNYRLASATANGSGTITQRDLTFTASGYDKVYDGGTNATLSFTDNRLAGDSLSFVSSAAFGDKNVGTGKTITVSGLSLSGADAANYRLTTTTGSASASITPRALAVSASAADKVYDGTTAASVQFKDDRVAGDELSLAGSASFASKNAGVQQVRLDGVTVAGADAANYTVSVGGAGSATIAQRALSASVTASDKVYDGGTAASVALSINALAGDAVRISGSGAFADKNAGAGKNIVLSGVALSGADAGNYKLDTASLKASAAITPRALVASVSAADKVYDGTVAAQFSVADNRIAGDVLEVLGGSAAFADKNAGAGKTVTVSGLSLGGADARNYALASSSATTAAAIARKDLTITANSLTRTAGFANPVLGYTVGGLVAGDAVGAVTASTSATVQSPAGAYPITLAGADLQNYKVSYVDGVLTVTSPRVPLTDTIGSIVRPTIPATPAAPGVSNFAVPTAPDLPQQRLANVSAATGPAAGAGAAPSIAAVANLNVNEGTGANATFGAPSGPAIGTATLPGGTQVASRDGGLRTPE
ncbi:filamentous hemagglutinin N-terminal domain-containing protein [Duganella sp. BJB488]|uniref:YDG domain-containing protein n=1 Tax=unclassified Duganella TaxID=2636909 RepID=UPI000E344EB2|nr:MULTISPECIES: YDG domain-containing protein [unclassified Duganella]RFP24403.1 filamentous hemagglutinin N-terminal domain-containing protein [Duganella sp. BJB489]RFP26763.1 filamentous hemagglutinin N-terminal domain-containing protein [Duganella sp. BJB488]RFP34504.1 filamentous hemagglutinin N-terminal domain-containing protein [Duganella sp. BJB480]